MSQMLAVSTHNAEIQRIVLAAAAAREDAAPGSGDPDNHLGLRKEGPRGGLSSGGMFGGMMGGMFGGLFGGGHVPVSDPPHGTDFANGMRVELGLIVCRKGLGAANRL